MPSLTGDSQNQVISDSTILVANMKYRLSLDSVAYTICNSCRDLSFSASLNEQLKETMTFMNFISPAFDHIKIT